MSVSRTLSRLPLPRAGHPGCLAICCLLAVATSSPAQEQDKRRFTVNDLQHVDGDFWLMGEYQGTVRDACGYCGTWGVQVVAMGDGKFGGMAYEGGLPGTGWNREHRVPVTGERSDRGATLIGDGLAGEISSAGLRLETTGARGVLTKVRRQSPTLGMAAPRHAIVLFDGQGTDQFREGRMTDAGLLQEGTELMKTFRDYTLHVEFRLPYMPHARGQGRSNSGLYLQSSYEVQILDSFGLEGVFNECGALYRYRKPDLNMCLPPLAWQTYDLTFHAPHFGEGNEKTKNARITVLLNGVAVHDDFEVERKTGAGKAESPKVWPTKFQDHSNPVRFRNIWLVPLSALNASQAALASAGGTAVTRR